MSQIEELEKIFTRIGEAFAHSRTIEEQQLILLNILNELNQQPHRSSNELMRKEISQHYAQKFKESLSSKSNPDDALIVAKKLRSDLRSAFFKGYESAQSKPEAEKTHSEPSVQIKRS